MQTPLATTTLKALALTCLAAAFATSAAREASAQWGNPAIYDSGTRVSGAYYDPFTGRLVVSSDRTFVRESALDPYRDQVDYGSRHYVNRIETDPIGRRWRVQGWAWTSYGVPHSSLSRTRIESTGIPGVDHQMTQHVEALTINPNRNSGAASSAAPAPRRLRPPVRRVLPLLQPKPRRFNDLRPL